MVKLRLLRTALLAVGLGLATIAATMPALADGTAIDGTAILPDPSLANGGLLPASAATAGVAVVSAAQDGPLENCSRHNPCAMPTPARDTVAVAADHAVIQEATPAPAHTPALKKRRMMAGTPGLHS